MPKNKKQGIIFGLIMSYVMAIGMEIYNTAINLGFNLTLGTSYSSMTYAVIIPALKEAAFMGLIVYIISSLIGNKAGEKFMLKHSNPKVDNPYICTLLRQAGTVRVMCPLMSLVATILFSIILGKRSIIDLPIIWIGTIIKNLPMAFFWNMFFAAPFTHFIFNKIFKEA